MAFFQGIVDWYKGVIEAANLSAGGLTVLNLVFLTVLITIVTLLIWKFYQSLSERNLLKLNLKQYNKMEHPILSKFEAIILYFIEYILIMPLIIFIWFSVLAVLILLIVEERNVFNVLLISAVLIASIRILAYHRKEVARDLAKLFPFIMLSVFLLSPKALAVDSVIESLAGIPELFSGIVIFFVFIFIVEIVLRLFYTIWAFFKSEDSDSLEEDDGLESE